MGRALGVDWGRVRIGLSLSDETGLLARPLSTVSAPSRAEAVREVARRAVAEKAADLVVGLPLNMDGTEGPSAEAARAFAGELAAASGLPVSLWDERLTTREGVNRAREAGRAVDKDQAAACVLLQSWLDARRRKGGGA